jgi:transcriptional regulator with XRE-family HTH domain
MDVTKLKTLMTERGVTQTELARLLGRDKSVVTHLLQGRRQLKADEATLIARLLGVPVAELLGVGGESYAQSGVEEGGLIPFHHAPQKARRRPQVVQRDGKYFLAEKAGSSEKAFALEVHDDSLNLAGILPGDIVISELDAACRAGDIVVVQHYHKSGAETLVRRYEPPFLMSHSTNPAWRPLNVGEDDVRLVSPVKRLVRLW